MYDMAYVVGKEVRVHLRAALAQFSCILYLPFERGKGKGLGCLVLTKVDRLLAPLDWFRL